MKQTGNTKLLKIEIRSFLITFKLPQGKELDDLKETTEHVVKIGNRNAHSHK